MKRTLLAAALVAAPMAAWAADVVVAVGRSLPPYVIAETWTGVEYEIVKEALALEGHAIQPRFMAYARVVKEMNAGLVDAAMTMRPDSGVRACYSDSHVTYRNVAITLARHDLTIRSVADLADKSVVAFQNASLYLGPEYRKAVASNPHYREEAKQVVQPLLLFLDRTQVVVADRNIFGWFAHDPEVTGKADNTQQLRIHAIFPPTDYHVAFRSQALCESFNRGLAKLRDSGMAAAITARYATHLREEYVAAGRGKGGLSR